MAKNLIMALRKLPQLRGSTFLAAVEIAHRCDDHNGSGFMSYSMIAAKTHQSLRTAFRQVERLEAMGIIAVQRFWDPVKKWGVSDPIAKARGLSLACCQPSQTDDGGKHPQP